MKARAPFHPPRRNAIVLALAGSALQPHGARADPSPATVLPGNGTVVYGSATVRSPTPGSLTIEQNSSRAIVDWNSFSIGSGQSVRFAQPDSQSAILNRVTGSTGSRIAGTLSGNGQVFLVNPNGIEITSGGSVRLGGGFVASTLDIRNEDFASGRLTFRGTAPGPARVVNAGTVQVAPGGFVALLGAQVSNDGTISAPLGRVALGAGSQATLDLYGDGFLQIGWSGGAATNDASIAVPGSVQAPGGRIEVRAADASAAWRSVVNVPGNLVATSVSRRDGAIVLEAGRGGELQVSGVLDASGSGSAGRIELGGGTVTLDGPAARLALRSDTGQGGSLRATAGSVLTLGRVAIDASGGAGGGSVQLGGERQGGGTLGHAATTVIGPDAQVRADALREGPGGRIVVWSDESTSFRGKLSALGAGSGDGGSAEVSSHGLLDFGGRVDLRAVGTGRVGELLLDPYNVTISSGANSNHNAAFTATGNSSVVNTTTLHNALATADVTVSTGTSGTQSGDITVASALNWTGGHTLTLSAARDVLVNASVTTNGGALGLQAGRAVSITNATINTGGGTLTATGTTADGTTGITLNGANLNVGSGTGTLSGTATSGGKGVWFTNTANTLSASGAGSITIGGHSDSSYGLAVNTNLTTSGHVSINGTSNSFNGLWFLGTTISNSGTLAFSGTSTSNSAVWLNGSGTLSFANSGSGTISLQGSSAGLHGIRFNTGAALTTSGPVQLSGTSGSGGSGFSLKGSNAITISSGNVTINGTASGGHAGVDLAASGISVINNGTGTLTINGVGGTTLAASITSPNGSLVIDTTGDLTLNSGAQITATSPVLAATGAFVNHAGSSAVQATSGRWLVYSSAPDIDTFGGLDSAATALWGATYATLPSAGVTVTGPRYLFATQPTLTFTSSSLQKTYGSDITSALPGSYTVSGYQSGVSGAFLGDSASTAYSGTPTLSSSGAIATATVAGGPYPIGIAPGTVTASSGYALAYNGSGTIAVAPKPLTVQAGDASHVYGDRLTFAGSEFSSSGLVNGDAVSSVTLASSGAAGTASVGRYAITPSGAIGSGLSNYSITYVDGSLSVTPRLLTIQASDASHVYGDRLVFAGTEFGSSGLVNGDAVSFVTLASNGAAGTAGVGRYAITPSGATGSGLSNYSITYVDGSLSVTPRPLTIQARDASHVYGDRLAFAGSEFGSSGLVNGDAVSSVTLASSGAPGTANVGRYAITPS
ncbi:MAG TPA: MBG domain-containing protein, partial [Burkholderiaceae bacterium]